MWFIAGAKTKARAVEGGRAGQRHCEGCKKVVTFRECDVVDTFHAFLVELFDSTQRRMVCATCGEDHDVADFFKTARPLPRPVPDPPAPAQGPSIWDRLRRRSKGSGVQEDDVDKELAALKQKLARKNPP